MAQITNIISADVTEQNRVLRLVAKQGDVKSRFLTVRLTNKGKPINVEQYATVKINVLREDGESKAFLGSVNADGTVTVPITYWMLENVGTIKCSVSVVVSGERQLTTTTFLIGVESAEYTGEDITPEDENYNFLVALMAEVSDLKEDVIANARIAESWAVGGTGTREGEDTNNSKYFSLQSKNFADNAKDSETIAAQALQDLLNMLGTDIATLTNGKLTPSQIPDLSINDVFTISNASELTTLNAQRGDCAIVVVNDVVTDTYMLAADDPTTLSNWKKLGVSYVSNAGHAQTADNADNATKINNKRIVGMTQSQYESAVLADDTYYFVTPDEV